MGLFDNLKSLVAPAAKAPQPDSPAPNPQVAAKKILVVEDDQYIRELYVEILKQEGYQTFAATNGEEGLQVAQAQKPDLILLDLMMPVMDGKTMLHKLRNIPELKDTPVIVLTNAGDPDSMTQTQVYDGAKGFLIKANVQPDEVISRVKSLL